MFAVNVDGTQKWEFDPQIGGKDGGFLAPFLTWKLDVSAQFEPLDIGASFQDPTQAARVHFGPAEASQARGLGIAVLNIGENTIPCTPEFFNEDGTKEVDLQLELVPRGSEVRFFNDDLPDPFIGSATFSCQDPVVAFIVIQDFSNGAFPSDFTTVKGPN